MNQEYKPQSIRESYSHLLSQDYDRLWDLICSGQEIIGVVESKEFMGEKQIFHNLVRIKRSEFGFLSIGSTGVGYSMGKETKENGEFEKLCKLFNLAFLDTNTLFAEVGEAERIQKVIPQRYRDSYFSIASAINNHFQKRKRPFSITEKPHSIATYRILELSYDRLFTHRLFAKWMYRNLPHSIDTVILVMRFPDGTERINFVGSRYYQTRWTTHSEKVNRRDGMQDE